MSTTDTTTEPASDVALASGLTELRVGIARLAGLVEALMITSETDRVTGCGAVPAVADVDDAWQRSAAVRAQQIERDRRTQADLDAVLESTRSLRRVLRWCDRRPVAAVAICTTAAALCAAAFLLLVL